MKSRFTEKQTIKILKEHECGKKAADIVRGNYILEQTFNGRIVNTVWKSARLNVLRSSRKKAVGLKKIDPGCRWITGF